MDKIKQFLKCTKTISRILVALWVFFSLAGAGFNASQFVYTFPIMAIFFLLPAILIERKKNTVWVKAINESKIKKLEAKNIANQQRKEEALRIKQLQEESKQLEQETDILIKENSQVLFDNDATRTLEDNNTDDSLNCTPVIQQSDNNSKTKKTHNKNNKRKPPISHRIGGIILIVLSSMLCMLFVGVFVEKDLTLLFPAMFGLFGLVFSVALLRSAFVNAELRKQRKGIYLSQEQVEKLEQKIELPVVDTPVFLDYGEVSVYHSQAIRQETKNRVIGRTGSYSGGTVRVAKGLSIHTGGSSSRPIYGDVSMQYPGEFIITNERIIFLSNQKGFEIKHQNITAATAYKDGFAFQSKNTSYVLLLPRADLATLAFDGVRTGEIPIAGIVTSELCDYDDCEDFDVDDISMIDCMDGHSFEYFCAEVLEKNGFKNVSVTKGSGDQGVDVLAEKDGIKYAVQCKNYSSALGNTPVQEVNAGKTFYNCHVGVVMTNSTFTPSAKELAQATGVLLWDRKVLQEMMDS